MAVLHHALVAQLVEHWAVMQEVVSLTPAGPTLRVLKNNGVVSAAFVIASANSLTFKSSRIRTISWRPRLTTLVANNCGTLKNPHTVRKELGTEFPVLWSGLYPSQKHLAGLLCSGIIYDRLAAPRGAFHMSFGRSR